MTKEACHNVRCYTEMRSDFITHWANISLFYFKVWGAYGKGLPTEIHVVAQCFLLNLVYTFSLLVFVSPNQVACGIFHISYFLPLKHFWCRCDVSHHEASLEIQDSQWGQGKVKMMGRKTGKENAG